MKFKLGVFPILGILAIVLLPSLESVAAENVEDSSYTSWTGFPMVSTTRENGGDLLLFRDMHDMCPAASVGWNEP